MRVVAHDLAFAHPGGKALFARLDFEFRDGDMLALTGPSGSGKSTMLSLLGGWVTPTTGSVSFLDVRRTALVPQNPFGVSGRTALDHVTLPLIAAGMSRRDADRQAHSLLAMLRLDGVAYRRYRVLSGGERQRMLLARALASQPDLLLVDEPTAQLDAVSAADVCGALASLQHEGVGIVVATHDPRVVAACSGTIDLLRAEQIQEKHD